MASKVRKKRGKVLPSAQPATPETSNPLISDAKLKQLYSTMLQCQILDERVSDFQHRIGESPRHFPEAAAIVGAAVDLRRDDWLAPAQPDSLGKFIKGVPLASIFSELRQTPGKDSAKMPAASAMRENHFLFRLIPGAANPAAQLNLASGVAGALKAAKKGNIVMAFSGDTSDSGQRWHEALTFAGRHCLPLLVIMHTRASTKTAPAAKGKLFTSILSEGHGCELPVIPVDADDLVAIYRVAFESIHKARYGGGPTLIHAISFAASDRGKNGETPSMKHPDAIARMEEHLAAKELFSRPWKQKLIDTFNRDVDSALVSVKKPPLHNRM
jgi:acetoin:2,6-dichlorophenolindophenol oxidoreductase subunit alpha